MSQLWNWLQANPVWMSAITLGLYHAASAAIGAMEMPDSTSGKFYRWFFNFANKFAANYARANASTGSAGEQPPKGN